MLSRQSYDCAQPLLDAIITFVVKGEASSADQAAKLNLLLQVAKAHGWAVAIYLATVPPDVFWMRMIFGPFSPA